MLQCQEPNIVYSLHVSSLMPRFTFTSVGYNVR